MKLKKIFFTKAAIFANLIFSVSLTSWTMDSSNYSDKLLDEIIIAVFGDLSPEQLSEISTVSKKWHQLSSKDSLWEKKFEETYSSYNKSLKPERLTWKIFFRDNPVNQVLNMENWSPKQIISELSEEKYRSTLIFMTNNSESVIINQAKRLEVNNPQRLVSFFIAYYVVNIRDAGESAIGDDDWVTAWCATMDAAMYATWNATWNAAMKASWRVTKKAAKGPAKNAAQDTLNKLDLTKINDSVNYSYKLVKIYILAYMSQAKFLNKYFIDAYNAALNISENDRDFKLSKDDVLKIIAINTWSKNNNLAKNPYLISLKNIMETVAKY